MLLCDYFGPAVANGRSKLPEETAAPTKESPPLEFWKQTF